MKLTEQQLKELIDFLDSTKMSNDDKNYFIARFHRDYNTNKVINDLDKALKKLGHTGINFQKKEKEVMEDITRINKKTKEKKISQDRPQHGPSNTKKEKNDTDIEIEKLDEKYEPRFKKLENEVNILQTEYENELQIILEKNNK